MPLENLTVHSKNKDKFDLAIFGLKCCLHPLLLSKTTTPSYFFCKPFSTEVMKDAVVSCIFDWRRVLDERVPGPIRA